MVNVKAINDERLGRWKTLLNRKDATPVFIFAVGHNQKQGEISILCTEDLTNEQLRLFLAEALTQLSAKTM